ncbi:MAG: hypothetical protein JJE45_00160 [Prolixibacteraceae bacterium]|nr:hypothetical protein [Prolixibacteraceae bacterium]
MWQKRRLGIMHRDEWKCIKCKDEETTLHVHHIEYHAGLKPWEYEDEELSTLCEYCHLEIERLKKSGDKTLFKDVEIYKFPNPKMLPMRVMVVLHGHVCSILQYSKENILVTHFPFGRKSATARIAEMFKKASEWEQTLNQPKI